MNSLRTIRLVLTLAIANLTLVHCGQTIPEPQTSDDAVAPVVGSATWAPPAVAFEGDSRNDNPFALPLWGYDGAIGPAKWGDLSPDFAACKTGTTQSPIDIVTKNVDVDPSLEVIEFGYASLPIRIYNDGHLIRFQNDTPAAVNAGGVTWKLAYAELHAPSEHTVDGQRAAMEMQLVHVDAAGFLSVVAVLFDQGKENDALRPLFQAIPDDVSAEPVLVGASFDLGSAVPDDARYYTYMGSLTTPRCTEGVHWFVLQPKGQVSEGQLARLKTATHDATNRPVQPLSGRNVLRPN